MVNTAIVFVLCKGRVLLLRRHPYDRTYPDPDGQGNWCLPGGKAEEGESPLGIALRELQEETGITPENLTYITDPTTHYKKGYIIHLFYAGMDEEVDVLISDEHVESRWFLPEEVPPTSALVGSVTAEIMDLFRLHWPLRGGGYQRLMPDAPGTFGYARSTDIHTGVDLYCNPGTQVVAMEPGVVIAIEPFTGAKADSPWWNDTDSVMVQGASGRVICYGEISSDHVSVQVGQAVAAGDEIGVLHVPVLRKFKGRPTVMLHLEMYEGPSEAVWWPTGTPKPALLMDPTPLLDMFEADTFDLSQYDGVFSNPYRK